MDSPLLDDAPSSSTSASDSDVNLNKNINKIIGLLDSPVVGEVPVMFVAETPTTVVEETPTAGETDTRDHATTESTYSEVLKDVVAYVEVRSNNENRSRCIIRELERLGAKVEVKFTNDVTHVIYKDGTKSTRERAMKKGVHLVSVLWVDSCKQNQKHISEQLHKPHLPDNDGTPVALFKSKRPKFMQPRDFEEDVARSAERLKNRRRKQANNERWKMVTPSSPHLPRTVFCGETQPQSPYSMDSSLSAGITIPDTPPSMRRKLQEIRRKKANDGLTTSPLVAKNMTPLQRRLFLTDETRLSGPGSPQTPELGSKSSHPTAVMKPSTPPVSLPSPPPVSRVLTKVIPPTDSNTESSTETSTGAETSMRSKRKKLLPLNHGFDPQPELPEPVKSSNTILTVEKIFEPNNKQSKKTEGKLKKRKSGSSVESDHSSGRPDHDDSGSKLQANVTGRKRKGSTNSGSGTTKNTKRAKKSKQVEFQVDVPEVVQIKSKGKRRQSVATSTPTRSPRTALEQTAVTNVRRSRRSMASVPMNLSESDQSSVTKRPKATDLPDSGQSAEDICSLATASKRSPKHAQSPKKRQNSRRSIRLKTLKESDDASSARTPTETVSKISAENSKHDCGDNEVIAEKCAEKHSQNSALTRCPADLDSTADDSPLAQPVIKLCPSRSVASSRKAYDILNDSEDSIISERRAKSKHQTKNSKFTSSQAMSLTACTSQSRRSTEEFKMAKSSVVSKRTLSRKSSKSDPVLNSSSSSISESSVLSSPKRKPKKKSTARQTKKGSSSSDGSKSPEKASNSSKYKYSIVTTSLHYDQKDIVRSVVNKLGGFHLSSEISDKTTHVVSGGPRRTLSTLFGITRGCWLVSMEWVLRSLEKGQWLEEGPFEMKDYFPAAQASRLMRQSEVSGPYTQDLFSKCGLIYVAEQTSPPHHHLVALIKLAKGKVTLSLNKADIHIDSNQKSNQCITEQWVLDSVTGNRCLPLEQYRSDKVRQQRETSPDF